MSLQTFCPPTGAHAEASMCDYSRTLIEGLFLNSYVLHWRQRLVHCMYDNESPANAHGWLAAFLHRCKACKWDHVAAERCDCVELMQKANISGLVLFRGLRWEKLRARRKGYLKSPWSCSAYHYLQLCTMRV